MGRMPANVSRRATHSGDGPIETGEITVAANRSHSSGDSTTTDALGPSSVLATFGVGIANGRRNLAAASRATPTIDIASGRFVSMARS